MCVYLPGYKQCFEVLFYYSKYQVYVIIVSYCRGDIIGKLYEVHVVIRQKHMSHEEHGVENVCLP